MSFGDYLLTLIQYATVQNPAILLALATVPLILLGRWKNVYPAKPLIWLVLLPVIPSLGIAFKPIATLLFMASMVALIVGVIGRYMGMVRPTTMVLLILVAIVAALAMSQDPLPVILVIDVLILSAMGFDLFSIPRSHWFAAERSCQKTASLGKKHVVTLTIRNTAPPSRFWTSDLRIPDLGFSTKRFRLLGLLAGFLQQLRPHAIIIKDDLPQEFAATPPDFDIDLPPRTRATLQYDIHASRRGAFNLHKVYLQVRSRLGLWKRIVDVPVETAINVYPDMKQLSEFEMLARTNRLSLMGVRRTRRVGQDNDFERLRDYTLDDNYKHIDWRSTARRQKLTVRDFQTSQSQRLIFMIDCGRMMTSRAKGLSLLDHSLNAMLMLSYIALRRGDSVGLLCFSDRIHSFVPPRGGSRQMNHLLRASFDRFPEQVESRYGDAFLHLSKSCRKRSLVILMTNLIDEINANQVHQYLSTMVGRHLPMGVLMRDHGLFQSADTNWRDDAGMYRTAAAAEIICWRHEIIKDLQHQGVLSLDVFPEDMTANLINQYLEVKARHLL